MTVRRWKMVCCMAFAAMIGVSGCSALGGADDEPAGGGSGALEKTSIKVATLVSVDLVPFWKALDEGYFRAVGLDVKAENADSGAASQGKVINGEADIALTTYPLFFIAQQSKAVDLRLVAGATSASPKSNQLMVAPNSPVKSVEDLPGKRIAITSKNAASDILTRSMMRDHGVDYSTVKWVPVLLPNMAAALKDNQVDAAYMPEPFQTEASNSMGATPIVDVASGSTKDFPITGFAATAKWAEKNKNTMAAFQLAMLRATRDTNSNLDNIRPLLPKYTKVTERTAALVTLPHYVSTLEVLPIQRVSDKLHELGALPERLDAANLIVQQVHP